MNYLSITWLFWMWITVSLYWLAPRAARQWVLIGLTLVFLLVHSPWSALVLTGFTALAHGVGRAKRVTVPMAALAIASFVGVMFAFKIGRTMDTDQMVDTIVIPLGLSYYTFRCIHYVLERVKDHIPPAKPLELVGYLFFLPTIVVGPIHRVDDYRRDLLRQRFDPQLLSEGAERIVYGYAKIAILSNTLTQGLFGDYIAGLDPSRDWTITYLTTVQKGLNLYFQFSGYSDIAIGFARLLGFRVLENFNWPYLQTNIAAFWRSWHMSLSQWCRHYIYGVVVSLTRSPALGALSTMVAIGLWHEISLRFLLWGAYHGLGIIVWQKSEALGEWLDRATPKALQPVSHAAKVLMTVHFVWFGFIILTSAGPLEALETLGQLLTPWR